MPTWQETWNNSELPNCYDAKFDKLDLNCRNQIKYSRDKKHSLAFIAQKTEGVSISQSNQKFKCNANVRQTSNLKNKLLYLSHSIK